MFTKIFAIVLILIAGFLSYVGVQPPEYTISRELIINASVETLFPYINNSKKSNEWMPWSESDPQAKMVYSGPEEGLGATTSWDSPGQMGTGSAVVIESRPLQSVKTQLTYTKPMEMSQVAEVSLTPGPEGTLVRWSVQGRNSFVGRIICVFVNMDQMVGGEFEKGLAKLKKLVEAP